MAVFAAGWAAGGEAAGWGDLSEVAEAVRIRVRERLAAREDEAVESLAAPRDLQRGLGSLERAIQYPVEKNGHREDNRK